MTAPKPPRVEGIYEWRCGCGSANVVVSIEDDNATVPAGGMFMPQCPVCGTHPAMVGMVYREAERFETMKRPAFERLIDDLARPRRIDKTVADDFVEEQWVVLAAAAWRNHERSGRGALLVHWKWVEGWALGRAVLFAPPYVTTFGFREADELIAAYDPETSIVVVFTTDDEATAGDDAAPDLKDEGPKGKRPLRAGTEIERWIYTFKPTPPAAHSRRAH